MKQAPLISFKFFLLIMPAIFFVLFTQAQIKGKIDLGMDTISKANAIGSSSSYVNTIRGSGQKATVQVSLPVEKMKAIIDACAAHNIRDLKVMLVTIRQQDLAHYRKHNPEVTSTDGQIKGSQTLVFRVPRYVFASTQGSSKIDLSSNNPVMLSLLSAGLVLLHSPAYNLPYAGDEIYLSFGSICPPPASCE